MATFSQRVRDLAVSIGTQVKALRITVAAMQTAIDGKQGALGFTAENAGNKGQPNGYASLDTAGRVPSAQLPGYVDDVLEFATLADFPNPGEKGKLFVDVSTDKEYRWSGTAYRLIVASVGSSDAVTEGQVNLYFTSARAQAALAAQLGDTDVDYSAVFTQALA